MEQLFTALNSLLNQGLFFMLLASFIWGVLSIALSPCHLTSIPLIIGFVDSTEVKTKGRRFVLSILFSAGMLVSIAIIGGITASAGRIVGDVGNWGNWLGALIFAVIGLHFLDVIPLSFRGVSSVPIKKKGRLAAFLIGLIFGVALGPCTFAFLAPVLAVTFAKSGTSVFTNTLLLFIYGIGNSLLIILAGTFTLSLQKYLNWSSENSFTLIIKKICGVFLLLGSLLFLWKGL
jgi:cytochrome c-type biogenesis protein